MLAVCGVTNLARRVFMLFLFGKFTVSGGQSHSFLLDIEHLIDGIHGNRIRLVG
jgi:hypothetical protein